MEKEIEVCTIEDKRSQHKTNFVRLSFNVGETLETYK